MKTIMQLWIAATFSSALIAADSPSLNHFDPRTANYTIGFESNIGQADPSVQFLAHSRNGELLLAATSATLTAPGHEGGGMTNVLQMSLSGANPIPHLEGLDPLPGKANYLFGRNPSNWRIGAATFGKVKYHDVYPGVDLVFYGNQERLEYDFTLQAGVSPQVIQLEFSGVEKLAVDSTGDLVLSTAAGMIRQHRPRVYQDIDGAQKTVSGSYVLDSTNRARFRVGDYDKTKPLTIDPVLALSQTFGGNGVSQALAVAVDSEESIYVAGNTTSTSFPMYGALQTNLANGIQHAFVTKFSSNGAVLYSTYLGGNSVDSAQGIAVDVNGDAFITGYTGSANFPVTNAFCSTNSGAYDAFLTELNPAGNALVYSTYFGGKAFDAANAIALDLSNDVVIEGYTQSTNLPVANAAQPTYGGLGDVFVAEFNPTGSALIYSTYLGGSDSDDNFAAFTATNTTSAGLAGQLAGSVAMDDLGNVYVTGWTYSTNFPATNAYQPTNATVFLFNGLNEGHQAFLTKFDPSGHIVYSTYFGGTATCYGRAVGVDAAGNAYIAGSAGFGLVTSNAFQPSFSGGNSSGDGFIAALDSTGTNLLYCTYLGGSADEQINSIAVSSEGYVAVAGVTASGDFPVHNAIQSSGYQGAFQSVNSGATWSLANTGLTSGNVFSIQVDPSNPLIVYAATANGCFKSTDGGAHWSRLASGPSGLFAVLTPSFTSGMLVIDPSHTGTIYVNDFTSIYFTTNGGVTWSNNTSLPSGTYIQSMAVDPEVSSTLYVGSSGNGVVKSTDGGKSWAQMNTGLGSRNVYAVLVDPLNSTNVYCGIDNFFSSSMYKSTNGGSNWTRLNTAPAGEAAYLTYDPAHLTNIYLVTGGFGANLGLTTNGGSNWSTLFEGQGFSLAAMAIAPASRPALSILASGVNNALTWPASTPGYQLQSTPTLNPVSWRNVAQTNNGNNLVSVPRTNSQEYYRLLQTNSTPAPSALYLAADVGSGLGVIQSADGGQTWNGVGLGADPVDALAANPANSANILAGLNGGNDLFVTSLTTNGQLYFSTYLGAAAADQANAIALDVSSLVVVGSTFSGDFPTAVVPGIVRHNETTTPPVGGQPTGNAAVVKMYNGVPCPEDRIVNLPLKTGKLYLNSRVTSFVLPYFTMSIPPGDQAILNSFGMNVHKDITAIEFNAVFSQPAVFSFDIIVYPPPPCPSITVTVNVGVNN